LIAGLGEVVQIQTGKELFGNLVRYLFLLIGEPVDFDSLFDFVDIYFAIMAGFHMLANDFAGCGIQVASHIFADFTEEVFV